MEIVIKAAQFLMSLSLLILLHELGHYIPARLFKTRVEKFYLFFDPWFSLFKFKRKDTEYGIGWLPLGGYCKISGMVDESMDKEQMKQPPQPHEFRAKKAWQRLIIILGGVTVNVLLAIFIYIFILFFVGEQYLPTKNAKYGIACDTIALDMGLKNGDKILAVDGHYVESFTNIPAEIILTEASTIDVERNGKKISVNVPSGAIKKLIDSKKANFISPRIPFIVADFTKESAGRDAGMQKEDKIVAFNDSSIQFFDEIRAQLVKNKNKEVKIGVLRKGKQVDIKVKVPESTMLGIQPKGLDTFFELNTKTYSFFEAIPAGFVKAFKTTVDYLRQLRLLFSPEVRAYESLGGFLTIGSVFSSEWDWLHFWSITAFLSIILAIMNVLPIPALDGGHVIFILYEMITGRKPSEKFMEYAQYTGMILLLALLVFANGNDIFKLFN
ncbi:MAG: RIP metalloprotease RseP [Bacteroidota bacterium]